VCTSASAASHTGRIPALVQFASSVKEGREKWKAEKEVKRSKIMTCMSPLFRVLPQPKQTTTLGRVPWQYIQVIRPLVTLQWLFHRLESDFMWVPL
jgi:hypothetical protein